MLFDYCRWQARSPRVRRLAAAVAGAIAAIGAPIAWTQSTSATPAVAAQAATVAVTATTGRVEFQRADGRWRPLVWGRTADLGLPITTRAATTLRLEVEGLALLVGPLSALVIREAATATAPAAGDTAPVVHVAIELLAGSVQVLERPPGRFVITVNTPLATIHSDNTVFLLSGDRITAMDGDVSVSNALQRRKIVTSGESVRLAPLAPLPTPGNGSAPHSRG